MGLSPDEVLLGWGDCKKHKSPSTGAHPVLYVPDFYLEESTPWLTFEHTQAVAKAELLNLLSEREKNSERLAVPWNWSKPQFDEFAEAVRVIKSEIDNGELQKAVPVVFEQAAEVVDEWMRPRLLKSALLRAEKRIPYGYWTKQSGIVGATPEILFSYSNRDQTLETMALAGTRTLEQERKSSLLNDPKEMYEHELVVRSLRQKLKCLGELSISPTFVWELGSICHLRTDFSIELYERPQGLEFFDDVIRLLHPTPALGIASSSLPFNWLKKVDGPVPRRRFGAPFGVINAKGNTRILVAIRNIQWDEDGIFLGSGCGVVAQSEVRREWQELEIKRKTVKDLFEI